MGKPNLKLIDMSGKKFNLLTVIQKVGNSKRGAALWLCKCDCGKETIVAGRDLRNGHIKSCGHTRNPTISNLFSTHKLSQSRLYTVFYGMKNRCYNNKIKEFKYWGGKGVIICDEWLNDFKAFYDWALANGYKEELLPNGKNKWTIDRIDPFGNYEPNNCRWVTAKEQSNNQCRFF